MRLANEKSLELNITHELMFDLGVGAIGFTQLMESIIGGDVFMLCTDPFILQFKVSKSGVNGQSATFEINNNSNRTQHLALDAISRSGICGAKYAFPLIETDTFFVQNLGALLPQTILVDGHKITDSVSPSHRSADWFKRIHKVWVDHSGSFRVRSVEGKGKGITGDEFLSDLKKRMEAQPRDQPKLDSQFINNTIESLESIVRKAEVMGGTEHSISFLARGLKSRVLLYMTFPIQLRGWPY